VLGASAQQIGLVAAAYALVALVLAIPGGRAIDRMGTTRVLYGSLIAMGGLGVAYAVADSIPQLLTLATVNGVVELGVWLSLQTLSSHAGTGEDLTRQLSLFSFAWGLGIALGPSVGGLAYEQVGFAGLSLTYTTLAVIMLLAVVVAPAVPASLRAKGGGLHRDAWRTAVQPAVRSVLLSSFVTLYVISIKNTFYPLTLEDRGVPVPLIGLVLSVMGVASLAVRLMLPALLRRFGPGRVLVVGTWVAVVGISATPWLSNVVALVLGAAITGAGYGSNPPVSVQLLSEHSTHANRGLVMGLRAASSRLAQVVQPVIFGSLAAAAGTARAFLLSGALLSAVALSTRRDVLALSTRTTDTEG
jgi:MFS family permease